MTEAQGSSRRGRCRVQLFNHTFGWGFELFKSRICQVEVDKGVSQDLWELCEFGVSSSLSSKRLTVCFVDCKIVVSNELDKCVVTDEGSQNCDGVGRSNFSIRRCKLARVDKRLGEIVELSP